MRKKAAVRLHHLSTGYRGKKGIVRVTSGADAEIYSGELTCLLGANGTGKSTLLRTLSAFQPPIGGEIWMGGKVLPDYSEKELARQVSIVLTERCDVGNLMVSELVGLGRSPYTGFWGSLSKDDETIVAKAMEQVGISFLARRMMSALSDGERQKVMIAKALAQQTPIVLLDEPTAFLDYPSKVEVMQLLYGLAHEQEKAIFLSTHDLELALQIADKLWLIDDKGIVAGTPEDLSLDGTLERFFAHDGICFDRRSGLFRTDTVYARNIRLTGKGFRYDMVRKALRRYAIGADHSIDSVEYIDAGTTDADCFVWHPAEGEPTACKTIEALLETLALL